ncbi:hypothetical protein Q3G72_021622 [Acer saccharum]|nr:hypothetical protein Q3G72_021622 [Acer saccharum]
MGDVQNSPEKEVSPYGPWLLVSYGKQGNRNFKGRVGKGGVNSAGGNNNSSGPAANTNSEPYRAGNMNRNGAGGSTNFGYGGSNSQYLCTFANRLSKGKISLLLVHIGSNWFQFHVWFSRLSFPNCFLIFPGKFPLTVQIRSEEIVAAKRRHISLILERIGH